MSNFGDEENGSSELPGNYNNFHAPGAGVRTEAYPPVADERYHFDAGDLDRVQRKLKQRHVQMYVPTFSACRLLIDIFKDRCEPR
jgi:hypothetical protein